jgi:hypothetical protein
MQNEMAKLVRYIESQSVPWLVATYSDDESLRDGYQPCREGINLGQITR